MLGIPRSSWKLVLIASSIATVILLIVAALPVIFIKDIGERMVWTDSSVEQAILEPVFRVASPIRIAYEKTRITTAKNLKDELSHEMMIDQLRMWQADLYF